MRRGQRTRTVFVGMLAAMSATLPPFSAEAASKPTRLVDPGSKPCRTYSGTDREFVIAMEAAKLLFEVTDRKGDGMTFEFRDENGNSVKPTGSPGSPLPSKDGRTTWPSSTGGEKRLTLTATNAGRIKFEYCIWALK